MPFVRPQRSAVPPAPNAGNYWGQYEDAGDLPNTPAGDFQLPDLQVGDIAFVTGDSLLYFCTVNTLGAAMWSSLSAGGAPVVPDGTTFVLTNSLNTSPNEMITRTFAGGGNGLEVDMGPGAEAVTGNAIDISMGSGATGNAINVVDAGSGQSLFINKTGAAGVALRVQDAGSTVFLIPNTGAVAVTPTSGTAFTVDTAGAGSISLDSPVASNFTVSGATEDLTLGARGAAITLNEAGDTTLNGGFTASSIVGALNELFLGGGGSTLQQAYDAGPDITQTSADGGVNIDAGTFAAGNIAEPILTLSNGQSTPAQDCLQLSFLPTGVPTSGRALDIDTNNNAHAAGNFAIRIANVDTGASCAVEYDRIQPAALTDWFILPTGAAAATVGVNVDMRAGASGAGAAGGAIFVRGGAGTGATDAGGVASLLGGPGGGGAAIGGDVNIDGGVAATAGDINIGETSAAAINIGGALGATLGFFGTAATGQSAAYTPTNVTPDRSFDADSTTLDEIADVVGTIIADLQAFGLFS